MHEIINTKDPGYHSEWMMLVSVAVIKIIIALLYSGFFITLLWNYFPYVLWSSVLYINPLINKNILLGIIGGAIMTPAIYQIVMGIALLKKKNWARLISASISSLIIVFYMLLLFIFFITIYYFLPIAKLGKMDLSFVFIFAFIYSFYILSFCVGLPLYSIIVLQRKKVKKIFSGIPKKWSDDFVIPEMIFLILNISFFIFSLIFLFFGYKFPLFWKLTSGALAYSCWLVESICLIAIVYFILKKNVIGWSLSFFIHTMNCVSVCIIFYKSHGLLNVVNLYKMFANRVTSDHILITSYSYVDNLFQIFCFGMLILIITFHLFLKRFFDAKRSY